MSNEHLTVRQEPIQASEAAPDFTLRNQDKEDWNLADQVNNGDVVLCFFPLAFTGVCSTEMKCITQEMSKWQDKGAQVVGISCDSFAALKAWADQIGLKQTLLADTTPVLSERGPSVPRRCDRLQANRRCPLSPIDQAVRQLSQIAPSREASVLLAERVCGQGHRCPGG